jgi:uncharacterized protein YdeI (YjbR/CyaY-like superfamily)
MESCSAPLARVPTLPSKLTASAPKPKFFKTAADFRAWLEKNGEKETELWMGYYKKASGKGGLTYKDALDEALCFGWIDGVVKSIDADSYMQRWTPRKKTSHWSLVNIRRMGELEAAERVHARGRAIFESRDPAKTGLAAYESAEKEFTPEQLKKFKANRKAWEHFEAQPPGYRRQMKHRVVSAKKEETRERRLAHLIEYHAKGQRIPLM